MNKKGIGVGIFVILGILIVSGILTTVYVQRSLVSLQSLTAEKEAVPLQVKPVQVYIEQCIQKLAVEAVKNAGKHGGYVLDANQKTKLITNRFFPTRSSNAVQFEPGNDNTAVAYWFYISCVNSVNPEPSQGATCEFYDNIPSLSEIQNFTALYIDSNLKDCLDNYGDFSIIYDISEGTAPKTVVQFSEEYLTINTNYLVKLRSKSTSDQYDLTKFNLQLPTRFKQMYDTAVDLTREERNDRLIDTNVLNWIDAYSGINKARHNLPPKSRDDLLNEPVSFTVEQAKEDFKSIMINHMYKFYQVLGSNNYFPLDNVIYTPDVALAEKATYANMLFKNESANVRNFDYSFSNYNLDKQLLFKINDKSTGTISPAVLRMSELMPILPLTYSQYNDLYSIEFPIFVKITDPKPDELFGQKFPLYIAWQVKIANNQVVNESNPFSGSFEGVENGTKLCDPALRNDNVKIVVKDKDSRPVSNAIVSIESGVPCYLGETNENGMIIGVPTGLYHAKLKVEHENYVLLDEFLLTLPGPINYEYPIMVQVVEKKMPLPVYVKMREIKLDTFYYCYNNPARFCNDRIYPQGNEAFCSNQQSYDITQLGVLESNNCKYPAKINGQDTTLIFNAKSVKFWNVSEERNVVEDDSGNGYFIYGEYLDAVNPGLSAANAETLFNVATDPDTGRFFSSGFLPGNYNITVSYQTNRTINLNLGDLGEQPVMYAYSLPYTITEGMYANMENYQLNITIPLVNPEGLTIDEMALVYDNDFIKNQPVMTANALNAIPNDVFPAKPTQEYYTVFELIGTPGTVEVR